MYTGHCTDSDKDIHYHGNCRGSGCDYNALGNHCFFYFWNIYIWIQ